MPVTPTLPDPALVVLVGASGAGKSTWAAAHYRIVEIVSSDALRAVVGTGPNDLEASVDAFAVLDAVIAARTRRRLTTVIDTLGLDPVRRGRYLAAARRAGLPAVAVLVPTPAQICRQRNAARDVRVPATALDGQLRRMRTVAEEIAAEGWDLVVTAEESGSSEPVVATGSAPVPDRQQSAAELEFVLQISRFPWGDDPAGWLTAVATAADQAGFAGVALMDHLIQIPQVGRTWEPIPEPWVTLGMLGAINPRLRLGTLVSPVTYRAPGLLAKTVATLDALTGGRVFCGLGAGWWEREHAGFGLDFPPPARRLDRLEETIETLRALWSTGTKAYDGVRVRLPETTSYPRPTSAVPIIVGGSGPRTLAIAARMADGCNVRLPDLDRALPRVQAELARIGRPVDQLAVSVLDVPVIGRDRDAVAETVERLRGRRSAAQFTATHPAGTVNDHLGRYRGLADRGVRTVFLALPDLAGPAGVERCATLIAAFAG